MLRPGSRQAHNDDKAVNKNNGELVGRGIYCSPHFTTCLAYSGPSKSEENDQEVYIVLQCRVKPESIRISNNDDYWVVN